MNESPLFIESLRLMVIGMGIVYANLGEDTRKRLRQLKAAMPNMPQQMLLRAEPARLSPRCRRIGP
ncbi:hypothetical protein [uncultured Thiodictyon sp.]|jgi:hypothetical protein|uniref:hypothetical protein n=1 Tax=uncultured Thiodictyon sp. TaxID=1846217 RepID=UPI0025FA5E87|nr:hypothetical protein [uncultured Thiodictyon sp.]